MKSTQRINIDYGINEKVFSMFYTSIVCDQEAEWTCEFLKRKAEKSAMCVSDLEGYWWVLESIIVIKKQRGLVNCEVEEQSNLLMHVSDLKGYCCWVPDLIAWSKGKEVWCTGQKKR